MILVCLIVHSSISSRSAGWLRSIGFGGSLVHCLKMEEASFVILRKAMNLFQVSDHEVYFVNHLSGYEQRSENYPALKRKLITSPNKLPRQSVDQPLWAIMGHSHSFLSMVAGHQWSRQLSRERLYKALQAVASLCSTLRLDSSAQSLQP
jgi:hypothetical protein